MKKLTIITALLILSSCSYINNPTPYGMYRGMENGAPQGTPNFRSGWKAGCESGLAAYGTLHYKATHKFEYDPYQLDNNEYHAAWRLGFRHCRWYASEWNR